MGSDGFKPRQIDDLTGFYRGVVIENDDPDQFGRIQVNVFGVFDGITSADLPWAKPAFPVFSGAGDGYGFFGVPEIGSHVWCFFEVGDLYQPCFFAEAPTGVHGLPTERTTNYPDRKVWRTKNGLVLILDNSAKEIYVNHPDGSSIKIGTAGDITVTGGDITVTGDAISITGGGAVVIEGGTVSINP